MVKPTLLTRRVSVFSAGAEANGASFTHDISANGRKVAFESGATNLVPLDTGGEANIFVRGPEQATSLPLLLLLLVLALGLGRQG